MKAAGQAIFTRIGLDYLAKNNGRTFLRDTLK